MPLPPPPATVPVSPPSATHAGAEKSTILYPTTHQLNYLSSDQFLVLLFAGQGGAIAWKSIRQNQTALSSCQAEIVATNECLTELQSIRHRAQDLRMQDAFNRTTVYNDNQAAVDWADSCTNKGTKHINLRENYVRELHQNKTVKITHIPGVINASELFTKELKDAAHYQRC